MNSSELIIESTTYMTKQPYLIIKRLFDIVVSATALIVLSPLFLVVAILVRIETKGKAIFTQDRIGQNGKLFKMYKFRSMVENADEILYEILGTDNDLAKEYRVHKKFQNDPRITKVGNILRRLSIDELPQLLNVLKGEMSLIGNRPYLPREINDMQPYYEQIVKTKPGITGLWQTNGRSNTTFKTRCKMEAEYSENINLITDIKIFFKTFIVIFKGL